MKLILLFFLILNSSNDLSSQELDSSLKKVELNLIKMKELVIKKTELTINLNEIKPKLSKSLKNELADLVKSAIRLKIDLEKNTTWDSTQVFLFSQKNHLFTTSLSALLQKLETVRTVYQNEKYSDIIIKIEGNENRLYTLIYKHNEECELLNMLHLKINTFSKIEAEVIRF